jgi:hypothetical protein
MGNIGVALLLIGIATVLVGVAGFLDTRKVDRRYKTGYKYNEPDTRNYARAGKRVLYGMGICAVGIAVVGLSPPSEPSATPSSVAESTVPQPKAAMTSEASVSNPIVLLDPQLAKHHLDSGVTLGSNERVVAQENAVTTNVSEASTPAETRMQDVLPQSSTANFSCTDDGTFFGANVCSSPTLASTYDHELKEYEAAQRRIGGKVLGVQIEQQNWVDKTTKDCMDMECLTHAFDARISDLHSRYRNGG